MFLTGISRRIPVGNIHLEETMSQNSSIGLSFYFMYSNSYISASDPSSPSLWVAINPTH